MGGGTSRALKIFMGATEPQILEVAFDIEVFLKVTMTRACVRNLDLGVQSVL